LWYVHISAHLTACRESLLHALTSPEVQGLSSVALFSCSKLALIPRSPSSVPSQTGNGHYWVRLERLTVA
jgi:hypothetical protein